MRPIRWCRLRSGKRLYEDALEPKQFMAIPDAGHNELDIPAVRARVERFIDELTD